MTTIAELAKARIAPAWFHRDAATVARELIGTALVHGKKAGLVVETEAYTGPGDLASHARFGKPGKGTARTSVMWGPGGIAYVYLCYGIHEMFNVVTGPLGSGQAVLVRAIAPLVGLPDDPAVGRGPGKVTTALELNRTHDRRDLAKGTLFFAHVDRPAPPIAVGPRVGVDYAGESAKLALRFSWRGHASVSRG
ncbi:MAG TPA: DNA-3-methyladenine glycosylase [Kofleriaceae bacterium]|jgi:DNA-3-methyladenine glycosylase